jgi:hypothetical protein
MCREDWKNTEKPDPKSKSLFFGPLRSTEKTSERPGNRPSVFIIFLVHCDVRLGENIGICHMFISWWCLLASHFHWDLWKIIVLLQWELKNACWTPSKNVTFLGWFRVSPQRQRFFSITSTCGPSLQWCHTHQHFDVCIAIAKPWHMSWSLDFG